jgi:hypothetical protein
MAMCSTVALASPVRTSLDHLLDREAVRAQDRFSAAFGTRRQQFERPPPVGLGKASGWSAAMVGDADGSPRPWEATAASAENARWDTIGTLTSLSIDIIALFPP